MSLFERKYPCFGKIMTIYFEITPNPLLLKKTVSAINVTDAADPEVF